jgi:chlorite dismutase
MAGAPTTLEGWYVLHEVFAVDWPRWNALPEPERDAAVLEATAVLERQTRPAEGHSAVFSIVGQKGDLMVLHWRPDLEALRREQTTFARTRFRAHLVPSYSYVSVVELGGYELQAHATAVVQRKGTAPGTSEFDAAVRAEMEKIARPRLFPEIPARRYASFYPMSKRRGEQVNWFDLSQEDRASLMRGHGEIGRKYAGQVTQIISGSVGLDDWEWGVTLFADDPLVFKKLVYEMRFDPASSRYALFGPFFTAIRFPPSTLGEVLRSGVAKPS